MAARVLAAAVLASTSAHETVGILGSGRNQYAVIKGRSNVICHEVFDGTG